MIILCADDYGLSAGVTRGIAELCHARRLSATSAMVTFERWGDDARQLGGIRDGMATGLHLNLTLGQPLVPAGDGVPHLARDGRFLTLGKLVTRCLTRTVSRSQLRNECIAQIEAFRAGIGALPDYIDGHQHVHVLPIIRDSLLDAINAFNWPRPVLVRMPTDAGWGGTRRRNLQEWPKRLLIAVLARGMRGKLGRAGLAANDTFAGFSSFTVGSDYATELAAALTGGGQCHIVMCHPGYADAELAERGDPVVARREEELRAIMAFDGLPRMIWHPEREPDGTIDWLKAAAA